MLSSSVDITVAAREADRLALAASDDGVHRPLNFAYDADGLSRFPCGGTYRSNEYYVNKTQLTWHEP